MSIAWLLRRMGQALLVLLAMSVLVFVGLHAIGNPADILVAPDASQADRARLIAELGLDRSIWVQYLHFLWGALHGDLGRSFVYNVPSVTLVLQRLPATLELAFGALLIAMLIGIPLGLFAGLRPRHPLSRLIMSGSILGFSLPTFWVGLLMIMAFSVSLGWLPASGRGATVHLLGANWSFLTLDGLRHMALPALNLSLFQTAMVIRLTRAEVREVTPQDYVKYARAKGLSRARVVRMHVLRNSMIPVTTVLGLELGSTIAGAVVTETIFAWPGAGKLILDSLNALDRPVIVAYLLVVVSAFVLINMLVDVLYRMLDPRVRQAGAS